MGRPGTDATRVDDASRIERGSDEVVDIHKADKMQVDFLTLITFDA
jgi:hypothetical protein